MKILLKCKCTDGEVGLDVRERFDDEDIRDYMAYVTEQIGAWHMFRRCSETSLEYMKMPVSEDKPIGTL